MNLLDAWRKVEFGNSEWPYEVSFTGRVRSVDRLYMLSEYNSPSRSNVYMKVKLYSQAGLVKQFYVHRLVARAFLPNPKHKPEVNHMDCDTSNNCASNLEWSTPAENRAHQRFFDYGVVV